MSAQLVSNTAVHYCVDSTGVAEERSATLASGVTACK
jgi:hypothetical protein